MGFELIWYQLYLEKEKKELELLKLVAETRDW